MPYARPSLSDLITRTSNDLGSRIIGAGSALRRSVVGVIAYVLAGAVHLLYGYINWVFLQVFPDTAEAAQLDRWASIWGITRKAAAYATGNVTFTGSVNGTDIPAGTVVVRADGATFTTQADVQLSALTATVAAQAANAGASGDTNAGVSLSLQSPIAGINSALTVASGGLGGGADIETDAALLGRLLNRIQQPPQGGDANDYIAWTLAALPAATRAWCFPAYTGLGTVGITFVEDGNAPSSIIPSGGDVTAVQNYINGVRPVTAQPTVFAPVADTLLLTIHVVAASGSSTATAEANVQASLNDLILQSASPGGTLDLSQITTAIGTALGVGDYTLSQVNGGAPGNVTSATGHIITAVTITWI